MQSNKLQLHLLQVYTITVTNIVAFQMDTEYF